MLWTVVYKDKDGNQERIEMEAENRAIVIGDMRKKGFQVINIVDGGLKDNSKKQKNRAAKLEETAKGSGVMGWIFLLLLLLVGGGVAWWYYNGQPNLLEAISEKANPQPEKQKPKPTGKAIIRIAD